MSEEKLFPVGYWQERGWEPPRGIPRPAEVEALIHDATNKVLASEKKYSVDLWRLADVLIWSHDTYGEEVFYQIVPEGRYAERTFPNIMWIGRAFADKSRRMDPADASFWMHGEVTGVPDGRADELLEGYALGEYTRTDVRDLVAIDQGRAPGTAQAAPGAAGAAGGPQGSEGLAEALGGRETAASDPLRQAVASAVWGHYWAHGPVDEESLPDLIESVLVALRDGYASGGGEGEAA